MRDMVVVVASSRRAPSRPHFVLLPPVWGSDPTPRRKRSVSKNDHDHENPSSCWQRSLNDGHPPRLFSIRVQGSVWGQPRTASLGFWHRRGGSAQKADVTFSLRVTRSGILVTPHQPRRMTMETQAQNTSSTPRRGPWNKGKLIGQKPPLRPKHVWSIRTRLQMDGRTRDLAMFKSGDRQQALGLRCRRTSGRGRGTKRVCG